MLWHRQPFTVAIFASVMVAFGGIGGVIGGLAKPKVEQAKCRVEKPILELIQQCPPESLVYSRGKQIGRWTGFEFK